MREIRNILENDVAIPDIVLKATEEALEKIPDDNLSTQERITRTNRAGKGKTGYKKRWIALLAVAVVVVGTLSVGAFPEQKVINATYLNRPVYSGVELLRIKITNSGIEFEWDEVSGMNSFFGFLMKDGTIQPIDFNSSNEEGSPECGGIVEGYSFQNESNVDVEQVAAILFTNMELDPQERPSITDESWELGDFIVVELPEE